MNETSYKVCKKCVLDTSVSDIEFDINGICNYCEKFDNEALPLLKLSKKDKEFKFKSIIADIKKKGKGRKYDCILGISGGVDSSYLALIAKRNGLRTLLVHFDNGWNSELSINNIEKIVDICNFDLHTVVVDWEEFKNLQRAYLKSSVLDIEVPTDHLIVGALYSIARKKRIKSILSGANVATEFTMPKGWNFPMKGDYTNLKNIFKKYGEGDIKKLNTYSYYSLFINKNFRQILSRSLLNYTDYSKFHAKDELKKEFDWVDYGGKHFESIFTRFYQGYILPKKFNIDKRRAHLSTLICSGEISRKNAINELKLPPYDIKSQLSDKEYVLSKLGFLENEFEIIMKSPIRPHSDFGFESDNIYYKIFNRVAYFILFKFFYQFGILKNN